MYHDPKDNRITKDIANIDTSIGYTIFLTVERNTYHPLTTLSAFFTDGPRRMYGCKSLQFIPRTAKKMGNPGAASTGRNLVGRIHPQLGGSHHGGAPLLAKVATSSQ